MIERFSHFQMIIICGPFEKTPKLCLLKSFDVLLKAWKANINRSFDQYLVSIEP